MSYPVSLKRVAGYAPHEISSGIEALLSPLGGMKAFVKPGQKVLIKPNMLAGRAPEKAVTTHPEVLKAVIRQAQQVGGIVSVGDSPGMGAPAKVAKDCGLLEVIEETGAIFAPFSDSVPVRSRALFHELELARDVLDAEVIINLPKLKTHQMMGMTCAVKNLFGAVVGLRKPKLHLQAGSDKALFARMLLELCGRIRPALSIVDGVVGMEGEGPGSGDPKFIGALLAGAEPLAVDAVACALANLAPGSVWTQKLALAAGMGGADLEEVELLGDALYSVALRPAHATDIHFGLPERLRAPLQKSLTARPRVRQEKCLRCGLCVKACPPEAMRIERDRLLIDAEGCIRCFCCHELCPQGGLDIEQGLLLRLAAFFGRA